MLNLSVRAKERLLLAWLLAVLYRYLIFISHEESLQRVLRAAGAALARLKGVCCS